MVNIDKIFFLCLCDDQQRVANIQKTINNLHWDNYNNIKINYVCMWKYLYDKDDIIEALKNHTSQFKENFEKNHYYINSLSNFLNHFNILGEAYFMNYKNILVIEDDIDIIDYDYFNELLNNIPDDADFVHYEFNKSLHCTVKDKNFITPYNEYYDIVENISAYSIMGCYYSRKMIEKLYNFYINQNFCYPDLYQYSYNEDFYNDIKVYVPTKPIFNNWKFPSTIKIY